MPNDLVQFSQKSFLWGSSFLNTSTIGVGKASNSVLCRDKFKKIKRYSRLQNPSRNYATVYLYVSNEGSNMILKSGSIFQRKKDKMLNNKSNEHNAFLLIQVTHASGRPKSNMDLS